MGGTVTTVPDPVRVVIGEDDVLMREGIARLLTEAGFEVVAQAGDADGLPAQGAGAPARRRGRRRADAARAHGRRPPRGGRAAAQRPGDRRPGALAVLRGALRGRPDRRQRRGRRLPAQGARRRRRGVHGCRRPGRVGRQRARPRGRRPHARPAGVGQPARRRSARASARSSPRWRRASPTSGIAEALFVTEAAVEKHVTSIFHKLGLAPKSTEHRRVLAVLTYLRSSQDH